VALKGSVATSVGVAAVQERLQYGDTELQTGNSTSFIFLW